VHACGRVEAQDRHDGAVIVRFSPGGPWSMSFCASSAVQGGRRSRRRRLGLLKAGTFKPTGKNLTGWYRSELSFASS
jgi:hypothetical protein